MLLYQSTNNDVTLQYGKDIASYLAFVYDLCMTHFTDE